MKSSGLAPPTLIYRPFRRTTKHWTNQILDPGSEIVIQWNRVFLVSCLVGLFLDPIYFYLPTVRCGSACFQVDLKLGIFVTFFRCVADLFYLAHMILKFRTAFVAPSSRVFGRGELVRDPKQIAMRYLKSNFILDLAATLPLPQFVIWFVIPAVKSSTADRTNNTLALIVLIQYVPRLFLIFPLHARLVKITGVVAKTAWAGAAYNILLFMLASHVLGASWYLLSIERLHYCWIAECAKEDGTLGVPMCNSDYMDCKSLKKPERIAWMNVTRVQKNCDPGNIDIAFKYGLFADALTTDVVGSRFMKKFLYCLWWGLRNLSSYGQNLDTSTYVGETSFCILICIFGLVLFSHLIGNMQTYLQSITIRLEEWRVKRRDTEEWMQHRQLPEELRERVRRFVQYKWLATRGVDEESILQSLPLDLRRDIQRHLCLGLVRRVPFFSQMDGQLLDAICERLVSSLNTQDTYIVREGDLVSEMLFIIRGQLESSTTNGGRTGFFNSITLRPGDFCGEELLTWALLPNSSLNLPSSTRTVRALVEVEAFALRAEDLKFVATQFKRLHSKKLQHAFRYYSHQWRTWGACFIQAAWRRYKKKQLGKELEKHESLSYILDGGETSEYGSISLDDDDDDDDDDDAAKHDMENPHNHQHLGATILASRFAKNTRANKRVKGGITSSGSLKMPKLLKPEEPDFSVDLDD